MAASPVFVEDRAAIGWRGFTPGMWQRSVNVREFIQRNYTPYEGDHTFLQGPTPRTLGIWKTLQPLFAQEREKGILETSTKFPPASWRMRPVTSTGTARSLSASRPMHHSNARSCPLVAGE
jgi:pyruvate-formate lyase